MVKVSGEEALSRAAVLNASRAKVIEEVMRLRHEQARLKSEIAQLAVDSNNPALLNSIIACW